MPDLFTPGISAMRAARPDDAETAVRRIAAGEPGPVGALNLLAQLRFQAADRAEMAALLRRARTAAPGEAGTHFNLGLAVAGQGRPQDAAGTARAVAMWYELSLGPTGTAATGPGGDLRHRKPPLHFLEPDIAVRPGREIALRVGHDDGGWWVKLP